MQYAKDTSLQFPTTLEVPHVAGHHSVPGSLPSDHRGNTRPLHAERAVPTEGEECNTQQAITAKHDRDNWKELLKGALGGTLTRDLTEAELRQTIHKVLTG